MCSPGRETWKNEISRGACEQRLHFTIRKRERDDLAAQSRVATEYEHDRSPVGKPAGPAHCLRLGAEYLFTRAGTEPEQTDRVASLSLRRVREEGAVVGRGRVHRDLVQPWRVLVGDARGHASIDFVDRHAKTAKRQPMAVARQGRRPDIERRRDGV
jgi:hypothetical protein